MDTVEGGSLNCKKKCLDWVCHASESSELTLFRAECFEWDGKPSSKFDTDLDSIPNEIDNCPDKANHDQQDSDEDFIGDACDNYNCYSDNWDDDNDKFADSCDNCPDVPNPDQADLDGDFIGDACDNYNCYSDNWDDDNDKFANSCDNCPDVPNLDQANSDGDFFGDACDNCPYDPNPDTFFQPDSDYDRVGDACDNCPSIPNHDQKDADNDGEGDLCDSCDGNRYKCYIWHIETVDSDIGFDERTSLLELDSKGLPHISYFKTEDQGDRLMYAYFDENLWNIKTVPVILRLGCGIDNVLSLALDSKDLPHIIYFNTEAEGDRLTLMYAYFDGNTWISYPVPLTYMFDSCSSTSLTLVLDSKDFPHISYSGGADRYLIYAYFDGSSWNTEAVDYGVSDGRLVLDSKDFPHISYAKADGLKYGYFDGSSWKIDTVNQYNTQYISFALDSNELPHISYRYASNTYLQYTYFYENSWHTGNNLAWDTVYNSLALDSKDKPQISYDTTEKVNYAYYLNEIGWHSETVDELCEDNCYSHISIAIDDNDLPRISYLDYGQDRYTSSPNISLKYAFVSKGTRQ